VLEAFADSDYLVVATTGGSGTADLRARYPYENIIIEDFIPFGDVMPYADVYITNGGFGGVLLAIQNELPLVVAGVHEGKNEINARIGYFGLGVDMKTELPSVKTLRHSVEQVLHDKTYKQRVQALAAEFRQYDTYKLCAGYVFEMVVNNKKKGNKLMTKVRNESPVL
jgi:UDP:flavonoid glycosyltransferase YjiC (YdhE family)